MVGEINFSILDQNAPLKAAQAFDPYGEYNKGSMNALSRQQAMQSQQMNALSLQKAQREMTDEASVRNALSGSGGDINAAADAMLKGGQYKQALEIKSKMAEQQKQKVLQAIEGLKLEKAHADAVVSNPTQENAIAHMQQLAQETGKDFSAQISQIQAMNPDQIKDFALRHSLSAKELLPKIMNLNLGGTENVVSVDPLTGKPISQQVFQKSMSPGERAADARGRESIGVAREANQVAREVAGIKRTQDVEMKLSDDYRAEAKGFAETATSMKKVMGALETADKNPASALAAGTAFMKILDPNSVVRESELGMALNASGWFDRAANIANTLKSGKIMTPTQKESLKEASRVLFEEAKSAQREVDASFEQKAKSYGANPKNIITDRGQGQHKPDIKFLGFE